MLNPDDLVNAWTAKLPTITDPGGGGTTLLQALGANASIDGYVDEYPDQDNQRRAILKRKAVGSILVIWNGVGPGRRSGNGPPNFRHQFKFIIRAAPPTIPPAAASISYGKIVWWIVNGIDPVTGQNLLNAPIHALCDPMNLELPSAQRQSLLISVDGETLDYFEFSASLTELIADTQ